MKYCLVVIFCSITIFSQAKIIYVNANFVGSPNNGQSWNTPFVSIDNAYNDAQDGDQIWFANGTYVHGGIPYTVDISVSFYGGFVGTESTIEERDLDQNSTLITGTGAFGTIEGLNHDIQFDGVNFRDFSILFFSSPTPLANNLSFKNLNIDNLATVIELSGEGSNIVFDNVHINQSGAIDTRQRLASVTINDCSIQNGQVVFIDAASCVVKNSLFKDNSAPLVVVGQLGVETCFIDNVDFWNTYIAIGNGGRLGTTTVVNSTFSNYSGSNANTIQSVNLIMDGCDFLDNGMPTVFSAPSSETIKLSNIKFLNNIGTGSSSACTDLGASLNLEIDGWVCENNNVSRMLNMFNNPSLMALSNLSFTNNIVSSNIIIGSGQAITLTNASFRKNNVSNTIVNTGGINSTKYTNCVFEENTTLTLMLSGNQTEIESTDFINNDVSVLMFHTDDIFFNKVNIVDNEVGTMFFVSRNPDIDLVDSKMEGNTILNGNLLYGNVINLNGSLVNNNKTNPGNTSELIRINQEGQFINSVLNNNEMTSDGFRNFLSSNVLLISNSEISDNILRDGSTFIQIVSPTIKNSVFKGNQGINTSDFLSFITIKELVNSTFYNNTTPQRFIRFNAPTKSINNHNLIIYGNTFNQVLTELTSAMVISHSNIQGGYPGVGNLDVNPQFEDAPNGDLRLSCSSPLLNKGENVYAPSEPDINGVSRIMGDTVDMGAFEFDGDPNVSSSIPQPTFAFSNTSPCQSEEISLINTTPNTSFYSYTWSFGDGSPLISADSVNHSFTASGTYTVELIATNACGMSTSSTNDITVRNATIPEVYHRAIICPNDTLDFTTNAACSNLLWTIEGGTILTGQGTNALRVAFGDGNTGNAMVHLDATSCGNPQICEFPVAIEIPIVPTSPMIAGSDTVCENEPSSYVVSNVDEVQGALYQWQVIGGTIEGIASGYNLDSISVNWNGGTDTGRITLTITHELLLCGGTTSFDVHVLPKFELSSIISACGEDQQMLSTNQAGDFIWEVTGSANQIDPLTGEITWGNLPGIYEVNAQSTSDTLYCNNYDAASVQLFEKPTVLEVIGETRIDTFSVYTYSMVHNNGEGLVGWNADGGSILSQVGDNVTIRWDKSAPYLLRSRYVASAGDCVSDDDTLFIEKDLIFEVLGQTTFCIGDTAVFRSNNDTIPGLTYNWSLNNVDQSITSDSVEIILNKSGFNQLVLTVQNGNRTYVVSKNIYVNILTDPLSVEGQETISPTGGGIYEYAINNPNGLTFSYDVVGALSSSLVDTILTIEWDQTGPYSITYFGNKVGESCSTLPTTFTVSKASVIVDDIVLSGGVTCLNKSSDFSFAADEHTQNVVWSLSGGGTILTSNETGATIEWSAVAGTYTISVDYDRFGSSTSTFDVTINPLPTPVINEGTICGTVATQLSVIGAYDGYAWSLEPSAQIISSLATPPVTSPGYYKVEVTDVNGCKGSTSNYIDMIPFPKAEIYAADGNSFCIQDSVANVSLETFEGNNYTYQWFQEGVSIGGANAPLYTGLNVDLNAAGTYRFQVEAVADICESTSPVFSVNVRDCSGGGGPGSGGTPCTEQVSFDVNDCQPFSFVNTSAQTSGFVWSFGDGTNSLAINPAGKMFDALGRYSVSLSNGCASASTQVEMPLQAIYTVPEVLCRGSQVLFTDYSANFLGSDIETWTWNFGDNTTEDGVKGDNRSTAHTYNTAGFYTTSLTVRGKNSNGDDCEHTFSLVIKVQEIPDANFTITSPDCDDNLYSFNNNGVEGLYQWDLDDGRTSTAEDPSVRYTPGVKDITVIVTDFTQCSNTLTQQITVLPPVASQEISSVATVPHICLGDSVLLTSPISESSYEWFKDGNSLAINTATMNATQPGSYSVNYFVAGCEVTSKVKNVTSFLSAGTVEANGAACLGEAFQLEAKGINSGVTVLWEKDGISLPILGEVLTIDTVSLTDNGTYTAVLVENGSACTFDLPDYVINGAVVPNVPVLSAVTEVCFDSSALITYTNSTGNETGSWTVNGSVISGTTDTTLQLLGLQNSQNIRLEITDDVSGCQAASLPLSILVDEEKVINFSEEELLCENIAFSLESGLTATAYTFEWRKDGGVLSESGNELFFANVTTLDSGLYSVKAIATGDGNVSGCEVLSDSVKISIKKGPALPIINGETAFCEGTSLKLSTQETGNFTWSTGETTDTITVFQEGVYKLIVTDDSTGCTSVSSQDVTKNPLPDFSFVGTGYYEWCASEDIDFAGLSDFANFQWKLDGDSIGDPNENLHPRKSGNYTLLVETNEGCLGESDTLRITSLPCACEVVTTVDDLGVGSLRDALYCANSKTGVDFIYFKIPGNGPFTLNIDSILPTMNEGIILDGFTQTKEGVYDIIIESGAYQDQFIEFDFGVEDAEINGIHLKGFNSGVVFNSNAQDGLISNNIFEDNQTAIHLSNGNKNNTIEKNRFINTGGVAVSSVNNSENSFNENIFIGYDNAISFDNSQLNEIEKNTFSGLLGDVLLFNSSSDNNLISDNIFGLDTAGVVTSMNGSAVIVTASSGNRIDGNTFVSHDSSVVRVSLGNKNEVHANLFGVTKGGQIIGNNGLAIEVDSSIIIEGNSFISSASYAVQLSSRGKVLDNDFVNNALGGIQLTNEEILMSENTFTNSNLSVKAIDLQGTANSNKQPASFINPVLSASQIELKGTALFVGDTVEVFYNNSNPQQALRYIGFAVAGANQEWSLVVPQGINYDPTSKNYYVNTATLNHETSELSAPYMTGCFSCICLVKNDNDSGVESLRAAIDSAHNGACQIIEFDIPATSVISLTSPLRDIDVTLTINGIAGADQITIEGTNSNAGFTVNADQFNINNLLLSEWDSAIVVHGNSSLIDEMNIESSTVGITILGNQNSVQGTCINCGIENVTGTSTIKGVVLLGDSNDIGSQQPNKVVKIDNAAIEVNGGISNQILYNELFKSATGIAHIAAGNNNHPEPTTLLADYVADSAEITGIASVGDKIQLFVSDFTGNSAYTYVTEVDITSPSFTIGIPSSVVTPGVNQFFVLTATDQNGNTSIFSEVVKLGDDIVYCVVENTNDTGVGSLREAVNCVNAATSAAKIVFALPEGVTNTIEVLNSGFEITNGLGVDIDPGTLDVMVSSGVVKLPHAFSWSVSGVAMNNLIFEKFEKALIVSGNSNSIVGNRFLENDTALLVKNSLSNSVNRNTFSSGGIGVAGFDSRLSINDNDFGETGGTLSQGVYLDRSDASSISNNDFTKDILINAIRVINTEDVLITSNRISANSGINQSIYLSDSTIISEVRNNRITGGQTGVFIEDSYWITVETNRFDSVAVSGVSLSSSENINITKNTAIGLEIGADPITLHYQQPIESNQGIGIPVFEYATYKNKQLILRGRTLPNAEVELFLTDTIGDDLVSFLDTTLADDFGVFEYRIPISDPNTINDNTYRATTTFPYLFLKGRDQQFPYTSEASLAFNPNVKICYVTNESDQDVIGSLRYNINLANNNECSLMLFNVPGTNDVRIDIGTELPEIIAGELTIDATSQPGYVEEPIVTLNQSLPMTNALVVNADSSTIAIHGIKTGPFDYPINLKDAKYFENSLSAYNDFTIGGVDFGVLNPEAILLERNSYSSASSSVLLDIKSNNTRVQNNRLTGALLHGARLLADSILFLNNEINAIDLKDSAAIISESTKGVYIGFNEIDSYLAGIVSVNDTGVGIVGNELKVLADTVIDTLSLTTGLWVNSCVECQVLINTVQQADTGIHVQNSEKIEVSGNDLQAINHLGIRVFTSDSALISSNDVRCDSIGVYLDSSRLVRLMNNIILGYDSVGILVNISSDSTLMAGNKIGVEGASGNIYSNGVGVLLYSGNNIIGGADTLRNVIARNRKGGVYVMGGNQNEITYNQIFDNDTTDTRPAHFAIKHVDGGNILKAKPTITGYVEVLPNKRYVVSGRALAGDSIHLYRSEGHYQNARYFVAEGLTNGSGDWSITVDTTMFEQRLVQKMLTLVATATDAAKNTSELSDIAYISTCFVTNNYDNTDNEYPVPNSFRQAVKCANTLSSRDSILFAFDGTGSDIPIEREMISLTNPHGIVFDGVNLNAKGDTALAFSTQSLDPVTDTTMFWRISSITNGSEFKNFTVQFFDTAMYFQTDDTLLVDAFKFQGNKDYAILIEEKSKNYDLTNLEISNTVGGALIHLEDSTENILFRDSKLSSTDNGIEGRRASNITIRNNKFNFIKAPVTLTAVDSLLISTNTFNIGDKLRQVVLDDVLAEISMNTFEKADTGIAIKVSNSNDLLINANDFKDDVQEGVLLDNVFGASIIENTFATVVYHGVRFESCDSILVFENEAEEVDLGMFELRNSERIRISQNIIPKVLSDTSDTDSTHLINLNYSTAIKSNKSKPRPLISGYLVEQEAEDCEEPENHLSIFIHGLSQPNDNIELFLSDTLTTTFTEYVEEGTADSDGKWKIKVPKKYYERALSHKYSFTATALDSSWNTSEEAGPLRFDSVFNPVVIKYLADTGVATLRDAVNKINCSDIHSIVYFEIEDPSPFEIVLKDSLPMLTPWRGFTMYARATQEAFHRRLELTGVEPTIIVNAEDFIDRPLFHLNSDEDDGWGDITGLEIKNTAKAFKLSGNNNSLDSISIYQIGLVGDTAIDVDSSSGNVIAHTVITDYETGIYLSSLASSSTVKENTIDQVNVAVSLQGETSQNTIQDNQIDFDSIGVHIVGAEQANFTLGNTFGSLLNPIPHSAIVLEDAEFQFVGRNHIPAAMSLSSSAEAVISVKDSSHDNQIFNNRIGINSDGLVDQPSNMIGIYIGADSGMMVRGNVLTANETAGLTNPGIVLYRAEGGSISGNFVGVDSAFIQRGMDQETFSQVVGIDTTGIVVDTSSGVSITGNRIINYASYGIDVRNSERIDISKNQILSDHTLNKGIQLNLDTDLEANDGIRAPSIDTNSIISINRISLEGTTLYPNSTIQIFSGYTVGTDTANQSLRFIQNVIADSAGKWRVELPSANFGFDKFNKYIAQVNYQGNSSEFSDLYTVQSLLCLLKDKKISLLEDFYDPCPLSQFTIDAQLDGLTYNWTSLNGEFDTIKTRIASIDTSAFVTLRLEDPFGCVHEEEFEVAYKDKPQDPNFIISSNTFVADTIVIIDVSPVLPVQHDWSSTDALFIIPPTGDAILGPDGKSYPAGRYVSFIAPDTGDYTITQRSIRDGCFVEADKEFEVTFKDPNQENPFELSLGVNSLSIYPSPVSKGQPASIFLSTTNNSEVFVSVIDLLGNEIFFDVYEGSMNYNIPVTTTALVPGMYILKVETVSTVLTQKFEVQSINE